MKKKDVTVSPKRTRVIAVLRRCSFVFIIYFSVTYFSHPGYAQHLTGPVSGSLGGAGRAAIDDGEQVLLNPAALVHGSPFTSSLLYSDGALAPQEKQTTWGIGFADNSEELFFSGAFLYAQQKKSFPTRSSREEEYHQFTMAQFLIPHLSVGAAVTYLKTKVQSGGKNYDQWDGHLGLLYNPTPEFAVGAVFYNVARQDESVPEELRNLDAIALGFHYLYRPEFRLRADVVQLQVQNPNHKKDFQIGFESRSLEFFSVRAGYERDEVLDRAYYTGGVAFDGPRMKIDYSYRQHIESGEAMHGVDLRVPFW